MNGEFNDEHLGRKKRGNDWSDKFVRVILHFDKELMEIFKDLEQVRDSIPPREVVETVGQNLQFFLVVEQLVIKVLLRRLKTGVEVYLLFAFDTQVN